MTRPVGERARQALMPQLVKFAGVGAVGFLINLVVFNALRMTVFDPVVLAHGPLYATVAATVVAIAANWIGNRYWAFRANRQERAVREGVEFFLVSLAGMGIPLVCLWLSHYVLGFTSLLADNVANNLVGLVLGTVFRFALYRWWVFEPNRRAATATAASARASTLARVTFPVESDLLSRPERSLSTGKVTLGGELGELAASPDSGLVGEG